MNGYEVDLRGMKKYTLPMSCMLNRIRWIALFCAVKVVELASFPLCFPGSLDGIEQLFIDCVSGYLEDPCSPSIRSHMFVQRGLADRFAFDSAAWLARQKQQNLSGTTSEGVGLDKISWCPLVMPAEAYTRKEGLDLMMSP